MSEEVIQVGWVSILVDCTTSVEVVAEPSVHGNAIVRTQCFEINQDVVI